MSVEPERAPTAADQLHAKRWLVLILLGVAQLMVTLDVTIVNIALPAAQKALHFSAENRQWAVTAYALSFGSLLLLGGKLGDLFGRKRTFVAGLACFAVASAIGGLAQSFAALIAARALQGVRRVACPVGAVAPDADLPVLPRPSEGLWHLHRDRRQRRVARPAARRHLDAGPLVALVPVVNLLVAAPASIAALRLVPDMRNPHRPKIDVAGVLTVTGGLFALVFGFANAETHSCSAPLTIISIASSAVLLLAFVGIEVRTAEPLLPLDIIRDRARGGACAAMALAGASVFSLFLFLTFFLQNDLRFTPLLTGVSFLPFTASVILAATINQTRVLPRLGARPVVFGDLSSGWRRCCC